VKWIAGQTATDRRHADSLAAAGRRHAESLDETKRGHALANMDPQVRHYLSVVERNQDLEPLEREEQETQLRREEVRLSGILNESVPKLTNEDLSVFVERYGSAVAA